MIAQQAVLRKMIDREWDFLTFIVLRGLIQELKRYNFLSPVMEVQT
jgi:hypothetical protein